MPKPPDRLSVDKLGQLIYEIRGQRVMLDSDLARIYSVPTFRFNEAIKRNRHRFPADFMFQLTAIETAALRSQIATLDKNSSQIAMSSGKHRGKRYRPYAFTEHGALQAANVLHSQRAVQMSVFVIRAFIEMRALLGNKRDLAQKLASLEKELKKRLDVHEAVIVTILQRVMDVIDPPALPMPKKSRIGFKP